MRTLLFILVLLLIAAPLSAQLDLYSFNQHRFDQQKTGMIVLGGWAIANITSGLVLANNTDGSNRYFHLMNAGWNIVNLSIAGFGYYAATSGAPQALDLYGSVQEHYKFQKVLLFNAGLDVGYMLGGLYLVEKSKTASKNPERLEGFGRSIILQGAFLFAFDLINYGIQTGNNAGLQELLGSIRFDGIGLSLVFQF